MREDTVVALIDLLQIGLDRRDLQPDEVAAALQLARAGKLLRSSEDLATQLAQYQRVHVA